MREQWPVLILVCKRPAPGVGKQRLAAHLSVEVTLQVAEALLECAIEDVRDWPGTVVLAPADSADYEWALSLSENIKSTVIVLPQVSGNLGQRLNGLDRMLRREGMQKIIYIGSDAPGLCEADLLAVANALRVYDTVFIPAVDGGVVLMAGNQSWPVLAELPWSTNRLGAELAKLCQMEGYSVCMLPQGFDVDELADLLVVKKQFVNDQRPARKKLHTVVCQALRTAK